MKAKNNSLRPAILALICSFLLCNTSRAGERLTVGIKGNLGLSKSTETVLDNNSTLQFNYGGQINYYLLPFLGIESGMQFTRSGYSYHMILTDDSGAEQGDISLDFKYDYMVVPAYLRVRLGNFYGTAGLNFAFNTGSSGSTDAEDIPDDFFDNLPELQNISSKNHELHLGAGYQKMFRERMGFFIELGYNHQLSSLYDREGNIEAKLWNFNIGGGLCVSLIND